MSSAHADMDGQRRQKIVVVGAGPVGALAGLYAARRGHDVEVYELRSDLRDPSTTPLNFTKSINLALSERGINAMRRAECAGLLESVLAETIPMHGRMIHGRRHGELYEESQSYDVHGRYIRAVDRAGLNKRLLNELEQMPNVKFFFNHKLTGADFKKNLAWFERQQTPRSDHAQNPTQGKEDKKSNRRHPEIEVTFDFMIGADGAHSAVRYHLMKFARMSYQQEYIDTLWCEFHIPPRDEEGGFRISPNHLHIWPEGNSMFIAIPSLDKSFTCTLFLPASRFAELDADPSSIVDFFDNKFPGVSPNLISPSELRKQYLENPHLPLISIKCNPYHYSSSVVILGDAAHAMVPFYGQGMNAGLEDVRVLFEFLDLHPAERAKALAQYSKQRAPDAAAINDLALRNYQEMASHVRSPLYRLRKWIEESITVYLPSLGWGTQYARVSFGNERYSEIEKAVQRQSRILLGVLGLQLTAAIAFGGWGLWRWEKTAHADRFGTKLITRMLRRLKSLDGDAHSTLARRR